MALCTASIASALIVLTASCSVAGEGDIARESTCDQEGMMRVATGLMISSGSGCSARKEESSVEFGEPLLDVVAHEVFGIVQGSQQD